MRKRKFSYETLEVGEELGTREVVISEDELRCYLYAVDSQHPWYLESSPFGQPIIPSTIFEEEVLRMLDSVYHRFGSVHAKQEWEFISPAFVGEKVKVKAKIADKYIKRGLGRVVLEMEVTGEGGRKICHAKHSSVISLKERR